MKKRRPRIVAITTLSGKRFAGKMFIDATYEGDLMAAAGVDYHVGREANSVYGEKWNGVQTGVLHHRHHFGVLQGEDQPVRRAGRSARAACCRASAPRRPGEYGEGDKRVQAYCYRMCLTDHPENRSPVRRSPRATTRSSTSCCCGIFDAGWRETFDKFDPIPNRKTDTNNHGPFSTDNIGYSYDYPEASYERRREILREHETYQKGWLYFVANDPRVPRTCRSRCSAGAWRRTSSRTTATGRTRSTSARRGG